jgi:leader peptidase (prepilin peptidase)/N-methyltransferase
MTEYLAALQADYPVLVYTIAFCFGAIFGSFLNVVIHRLPLMLQREWEGQAHEVLGKEYAPPSGSFNLVFPNSHCPSCDTEIKPWENIPLISYAFLGGKCGHCGTHISLRYPLIEALTGILVVLVVFNFGLTYVGLACTLMTLGLIAGSMIDYDHQLLPDDITLPLLWLGLMVNYFELLTPFADAFWGAVAGYLVLWTVYHVFKLVTGKEGMGYGDFKLLAMLGAWLGWQQLPLIIILSSFAGAIIGGGLILFGRDRAQPIPFGPYLSIAGFIALLWGDDLTSAYLQFAAF